MVSSVHRTQLLPAPQTGADMGQSMATRQPTQMFEAPVVSQAAAGAVHPSSMDPAGASSTQPVNIVARLNVGGVVVPFDDAVTFQMTSRTNIEGVAINDEEMSTYAFDYSFDSTRKTEYVEAIRRYYPGLEENRLVEGYTGIRPKICGPGEQPVDFLIQGPEQHKISGLVNLFGIESPGLTSSLAIADRIAVSIDAHVAADRRAVLFERETGRRFANLALPVALDIRPATEWAQREQRDDRGAAP